MGKQRAIVFLNGRVKNLKKVKNLIIKSDFLVGVDGGTKLVTQLGLKPDLIIGDLDSLSRPPKGAPVLKYPVDKDQTDSELALKYLLGKGFKETIVIGFMGQRLDHMLANLMIFTSLPLSITVYTDKQTLFLVKDKLTLSGKKGQIISLIPLKGDCLVTTKGLKWPLKKEKLKVGAGRGVSNVMTGKKTTIRVSQGTLLVCYNYL